MAPKIARRRQKRSTPQVAGLEQYAPMKVLQFAGSVLVIAAALKIVGVDFEPIMQAYTKVIVHEIESMEVRDEKIRALEARIKQLEALAHAPAKN